MNEPSAYSLGLLLLGVALLVAVRLAAGKRLDAQHDPSHLLLTIVGWCMLLLALLSLLERFLGMGFGIMFWLACFVVAGMAASRRRAGAKSALLWVLAVAAEKWMPLASAVRAFADEWGGRYGERVRDLAVLLEAGLPLGDALKRHRRLLSDAGIVAAHVGAQTGRLGQALREAALASSYQEPLWQGIASRMFYLCLAVDLGLGVVFFFFVKIIPAMEAIFADFGVELPALTQVVINLAQFIGHYAFVLAPLALIVGVGVPLWSALYYLGWVGWRVPLVERLGRRLETALILRSLALSTESQQPLVAGVTTLSEVYPRDWVRHKLMRAGRSMAAGADWRQALLDQRLIGPSDHVVLGAAERVGNLPWAMRELADGHERRLAHRLEVLFNIGFVMAILCFAVLGCIFALGAFLPLVKIIETLA